MVFNCLVFSLLNSTRAANRCRSAALVVLPVGRGISGPKIGTWGTQLFLLEHIPERLVVDLVVELHFAALDDGAQFARAAVGRGQLQFGIAALYVFAQNRFDPGGRLEVRDGLLDVVGQIASAGAQVLRLGDLAVEAGLEDAVEREIGVGVRGHGADFRAHGAVVADGNADHGAAIDGRGANLVGSLEVRVQTPVGVYAGVEDQAQVQRAGQDAVEEVPAEGVQLLFALLIPEQIGLALGDGDVGVHAAAVDADDRLVQVAGREAHVVGDLAGEQLVELNLVGRAHRFSVTVVDLELAGGDFRGILLDR